MPAKSQAVFLLLCTFVCVNYGFRSSETTANIQINWENESEEGIVCSKETNENKWRMQAVPNPLLFHWSYRCSIMVLSTCEWQGDKHRQKQWEVIINSCLESINIWIHREIQVYIFITIVKFVYMYTHYIWICINGYIYIYMYMKIYLPSSAHWKD